MEDTVNVNCKIINVFRSEAGTIRDFISKKELVNNKNNP